MQSSGVWVFVIMALVVIIAILLIRMLKMRDASALPDTDGAAQKYGLPITPRDQRLPPEQSADGIEEDALSSMAAGVAAAPVLQPVPVSQPTKDTYGDDETVLSPNHALHHESAQQPAYHDPALRKTLRTEAAADDQADQDESAVTDIEFHKQSPVLDRHLDEQQQLEQNNDPLLNATSTVSIMVMPRNTFAGIPGKTVLNLARQYGLKYGVMNLFHRYENEDGTGDLYFSVLGVGHEGVRAFDLNTLPDDHFLGLTLFLPLPHAHALRGYDSMVSVANTFAQELDAELLDEEGYQLDEAYFTGMRDVVVNHQVVSA